MEAWLQDDVLWTDGVEQSCLFHGIVYPDEFLVEGYRKWAAGTQACHLRPLVLSDGLFDGVDAVLCQLFQPLQCFLRGEAAVGIHTQFHLLAGEGLADVADEVELFFKVDGSDFQFHTAESRPEFLLQPSVHLVESPHPDQSVDGDAFLATSERRIEEIDASLGFQLCFCRLQSEEHGGIGTHCIGVDASRPAEAVAESAQFLFILAVGHGIA